MKGSMLCSERNVAGWRRANAQPSIFLTWRKKSYSKKTIGELRLQDESTTCNEQEILDQIEDYFKNLYSSENTFSQEDYEKFIHNLEIPRLSNEDRDSLEGPLTYEECKKVLDSLQNDKSPGVDGCTVEFYKFFYDLLGNDLLACLNEAYEKQDLTISRRRGIITLLPKEDGSLLDLHNWRPITLLNVNSKVAAKAIAKRLETVLPNLIHPDQRRVVTLGKILDSLVIYWTSQTNTKSLVSWEPLIFVKLLILLNGLL